MSIYSKKGNVDMQASQKMIDQFMWGYQEHYYSALKSFAEKYFNSVFPGIYNQVFIVGTLLPGKNSKLIFKMLTI